ncbi:TPA: hypothetical protein DIC20_03825 [Candidatus Dependentiae bacterium]|nr:MAG: hypothetical protein US03_C0001G0152 [candidate division TM6 bacterium GW2011_GWF2_36_131]KKQ03712.1 MAG: hypothetical protein US13_C0001G0052 [candidate division TM6 bacterium GW2011_GWE2_36_25]KKQ20052.1 MAG: hypothetical protein US32_C0002G0057 [candidate division TM6 bacterium GW2011_GWA2_36_9]HBR70479.1 hypothetical protein [Candidatus Dependentiae bacterium]HCU00805.1 hypothetical protein [Candidatus Dependentiae bacterium]
MRKFLFYFLSLFFILVHPTELQYYCTYADSRHYELLLNLIGSIHRIDFDRLGEIMVFDLGLNEGQRKHLDTIQKANVYEVEKVNSDILTPFVSSPSGKIARGWFTWKPVVIKQALDKYPYVLCIDAGVTVLKSLDYLFEYIREHGYFLISNLPIMTCNIARRVTRSVLHDVINKEDPSIKNFLLKNDTIMISAGLQGLSRDVLDSYVVPMYKFAHKPYLFADDKTARAGFGEARHDQTLFSVLAHKLKMKIHPEGWTELDFGDGKKAKLHTTSDIKFLNKNTNIFISKKGISRGMKKYIFYK